MFGALNRSRSRYHCYTPNVVKLTYFYFLLDADIPDAGPTLHSVSKCGAAEVGQTGGASQSHMYYEGECTVLHKCLFLARTITEC